MKIVRILEINVGYMNEKTMLEIRYVSGYREEIELNKTIQGTTNIEKVVRYKKPTYYRAFLSLLTGVNNKLNISEIAECINKSRKYVRARIDDFDFTLNELECLYKKYANKEIKDFLYKMKGEM